MIKFEYSDQYSTASITVHKEGIGLEEFIEEFGSFLTACGYNAELVQERLYPPELANQREEFTSKHINTLFGTKPESNFYQDDDGALWSDKLEEEHKARQDAYEEYLRLSQEIDLGGS